MSDPRSSFSCEVASTSFALRIFFFFGSDSSTRARLLFRADTREVGKGDRERFFDADRLFCPARSNTSELESQSESEDITKTGAC